MRLRMKGFKQLSFNAGSLSTLASVHHIQYARPLNVVNKVQTALNESADLRKSRISQWLVNQLMKATTCNSFRLLSSNSTFSSSRLLSMAKKLEGSIELPAHPAYAEPARGPSRQTQLGMPRPRLSNPDNGLFFLRLSYCEMQMERGTSSLSSQLSSLSTDPSAVCPRHRPGPPQYIPPHLHRLTSMQEGSPEQINANAMFAGLTISTLPPTNSDDDGIASAILLAIVDGFHDGELKLGEWRQGQAGHVRLLRVRVRWDEVLWPGSAMELTSANWRKALRKMKNREANDILEVTVGIYFDA